MPEELRSIEPIRPVLSQSPLLLLSDIDGTLAPIVADPDEARVPESIVSELDTLADHGVRVCLVTGRDLAKAREMAPVRDAWFAANHGLTVLAGRRDGTPIEAREYEALAREVADEMAGLAAKGVLIENKGPVLAFHYRTAPDETRAVTAIRAAIAASAAAGRFRVHEGRKVIELRPDLPLNKGTATARFIEMTAPRGVLCIGDDITDKDMFSVVRGAPGISGVCLAVASDEADPGVLAAADYVLDGVPRVEWLLGEILKALPR